ncbi:MAG: Holliday junction resolvase RuvX [Deltaproteobacteria bacterium]|nr:Holliday junction resolvase RuvX [Deltaproteobacteria bacterium]
MIRVLGIDVGKVRIGVALSDPLGITAQPLEVIDRRKTDTLKRIIELINQHEVNQIVIGYPLQLNGEASFAAAYVDEFINSLAQHTSVPIKRWDERLTTAGAQRTMISAGVRRNKRRQTIDKVAAAIMLQSFLDMKST